MPYEWISDDPAPERSWAAGVPGEPVARLHLWPHRSLPARGFAGFFVATALLALLPLLAVLGSPVLWFILPPMLGAGAGTWWALRQTTRSGEVEEVLRLWPDRVTLTRRDPKQAERSWEANPHWVRTALHATGGPVPNYLTLTGAGRTVELGAFLSEGERVALRPEVEAALGRLR